MISLLKKLVRAICDPRTAYGAACLLTGILTATFVWAWQTQFAMLLGNSIPVSMAALLAAATGIGVGLVPSAVRFSPSRSRLVAGGLLFGVALWVPFFPTFLSFTSWAAQQCGPALIDYPSFLFAFAFGTAFLGVGIPCVALCMSWIGISTSSQQQQVDSETSLTTNVHVAPLTLLTFGFGGGFIVAGSGLGPWLGIHTASLVASIIAGLVGLYCLWQSSVVSREPVPAATLDERQSKISGGRSMLRQVGAGLAAALIGAMAVNASRMSEQLFLNSGELHSLSWAAAVIGVSLGIALAAWRVRRGADVGQLWGLSLALFTVWAVALTAAFPMLVEATLWMNSYQSSRFLAMSARAGILALYFLPMGLSCGVLAIAACHWRGVRRPFSSLVQFAVIPVALGACGYHCIQLSRFGPADLMTALTGCLWGALAIVLLAARSPVIGWTRRAILSGCFAAVVVSPLWRHHYDPAMTAKTLFSTDIFLAYRSEFDRQDLLQFDDARLDKIVAGDRQTYTIWKRRGSQIQIRENGLSKHVIASDSALHPQYSAEILPGIVPLMLHDQPERVMFLGLGSGVQVAAGLHFPLIDVVCVEGDESYLEMMRQEVLPSVRKNPLVDDRVSLRQADPVLVALCDRQEFDVIVSSPGYSSQTGSASSFTREFYRNVASQLAPHGIFAQRFRYIDYGAEPLRIVARTLQSVFENVLFLQAAQGEMLLLASNDPQGIVREHLLERASQPHVQSALADCGWHWSILLNLSAHNAQHLEELAAYGEPVVNTVSSGHFYCNLPREVMRWGQKLQEVSAILVPQMGRLLDEIGDEKDDPDLLEHLAEVTGQQKLIRDFPDQFWAYRASLREQVTRGASDRSVIQQIKHQLAGHKFHPRDRRRMRYFKALGEAAKSKSTEDIRRVGLFAAPFDTMLSYFLHEEVAELYSRSGDQRDPADELRHRLYATYYSVPGDRSVRNIVDTMNLLMDYPDAEPDPLRRWDQMNGLLQMLQTRWYVRGSVQPKSFRVMISDVSESLRVSEKAFVTMRELTESAGIPAETWTVRERVLRRTLMKPLSDYRIALKKQRERARATGQLIQDTFENGGDDQ